MTVASFIAAQRAEQKIPHAVSCRALEVPSSTFTSGGTAHRLPARNGGLAWTRR
jgi:hypothetical protein